ncbi:MAG: DUF4340 domain-containing protein [Pseudomonadota bacterium]
MGAPHDSARRWTFIVLIGVLVLLVAAATLSLWSSNRQANQIGARGGLVWPAFESGADDIHRIKVRLADDSYTLERTDDGWGMVEADFYPIRQDRLSTFAQALTSLRWGEAKTKDPAKYNRLSLGDPQSGGAGALVQAWSEDGARTGALITGRRAGKIYGRQPDAEQTYRLHGDLPPLYTRDGWLDLKIVDMRPDAVRAAKLTDASGRSLMLTRSRGSGLRGFSLSPANDQLQLVSPLSAASAALALPRLAPINVVAKKNLSGSPVARHVTMTFDGLEVDTRAYKQDDRFFVTIRAIEAGEGAARAKTINANAADWAFEVTELDWVEFAAPLGSIAIKTDGASLD